jgi:hypothetical protein
MPSPSRRFSAMQGAQPLRSPFWLRRRDHRPDPARGQRRGLRAQRRSGSEAVESDCALTGWRRGFPSGNGIQPVFSCLFRFSAGLWAASGPDLARFTDTASTSPASESSASSGVVLCYADNLLKIQALPSQVPTADVVHFGVWAQPEDLAVKGCSLCPRNAPTELAAYLAQPTASQLRDKG